MFDDKMPESQETPVLSKFTFITDVPMKSLAKDDGKKRVRLTASTDAEDLVGDIMSKNALQQMENAAPGTTIFLNHDATVPESVFGAVEKAQLVERKVPVTQENGTKSMLRLNCLDYDVIVEESNPRAVDTWKIIDGGTVQLGASVTIGVTDTTALKGGRQQIDGVIYLETSIVGIPCNQTAWAWSKYVKSNGWYQKASKSWKKSEKVLDLISLEGTPVDLTANEIEETPELKSEKEATVDEMSVEKTIENVKTSLRKAANREQAVIAFKDLFTESVENHMNSPWLYLDLLSYAVMDLLYWNDMMPSDEKIAAADEMFDAFKMKMLEIMGKYWADEDDEKSASIKRAFLLDAAEYVVKAGKRNNKKDKARIQDIHDLAVEMEAECMEKEKEMDIKEEDVVEKSTDTVEEASKATEVIEEIKTSESPAVAELAVLLANSTKAVEEANQKFAEFEAKNKELEEKLEGMEKELISSKEEAAKWKVLANTAAAVVEEHLNTPLE